MKHVAVLWWLLIYWSEELVAKSRILQTQVIGHLTERLPTLRGGIQGQSSLSQSEYSAPEPPKLEKLNAKLCGSFGAAKRWKNCPATAFGYALVVAPEVAIEEALTSN